MVPVLIGIVPIMNRLVALASLSVLVLGTSCGSQASSSGSSARPRIVVTYSVLGAVVNDVVGSAGDVVVLMPNGANPHEWSASAKDVETMLKADLVIDNGLGLEGNLQDPLREAKAQGVRVFTVADHIKVRKVKAGEGTDTADPDQAPGADDPHLWMDPLTMRQWIAPLVATLEDVGIDAAASGARVGADLEKLNVEVESILERIPAERRRLVTGHESMGYFAERYQFKLIGAIVPSITTQAEASAGQLADITAKIRDADVPAIFAEIGTPAATVKAIASDSGAKVVELSTHNLPTDGTYRSFMLNIATTVADALS
jgi:zinc/manganese transport system substrate-binding protein